MGKHYQFPMEKLIQIPNHLRLLQEAFRDKRFTMRGAGKVLGVDHKTVHNYVFGKTPIPKKNLLKLAKATLGVDSQEEFLSAWEKEEKNRLDFLNHAKQKKSAIKQATDAGFYAVISSYASASPDEKLLSEAYKQMQAKGGDSIYKFYDLQIKRHPVDVFVDVYRKVDEEKNERVFIVTPDYGLSFFPGDQTSEWELSDGTKTEVSGTLGTDEDKHGPIKLLQEYCRKHGVTADALLLLVKTEVQTSMKLEPESYESNKKVFVPKSNVQHSTKNLLDVLKILRSKKTLSIQKKNEAINLVANVQAWLEGLENKANETVSAKSKIFSKIDSIIHMLP